MKIWISLLVLLAPLIANACSCIDRDVKEIITESKYIFTAKVTSVQINKKAKEHFRGVVAEIDITSSVKGNPKFNKVYSGFGGGDCGLIFNVGWEYIFYTKDDTVGICSKSSIYPGSDNDDGYIKSVKSYLKSGQDFDAEDYFFIVPDLSCE